MDKEEKRSVLLCYVGRRRFDSLFIRKKKKIERSNSLKEESRDVVTSIII